MVPSDMFLDCKVCQDIWRGFADHNAIHKINLGSFEDALSSECSRHTPLVERFRDYCHNRNANIHYSDDIGISVFANWGVQLTKSLSVGGLTGTSYSSSKIRFRIMWGLDVS